MDNEISSRVPRLMFAAANSGAGKTSVTCAVIRAMMNAGKKVAAFKCGPDYIDPMFHSKVIGAKSSNLDIYMCGEEGVRFLMCKNSAGADIAVTEGVMGLYDGLDFGSDYASSNHLSRVTETPLILVVNVRGMSTSLAALVQGFMNFAENRISGVVLNNCTEGSYPSYKKLIEDKTGLKVCGYLPHLAAAEIGSRHLGLITAGEIADLQSRIELLARQAEKTIDIDAICAIAASAGELRAEDMWKDVRGEKKIRLALAKDRAFCFFYADNLELLERCGAELLPFSPLSDEKLPENVDGLLLFGGYPEEYTKELSENAPMRGSVAHAVKSGMPVWAECGGFMYLLDEMAGRDGVPHPMAGAIAGKSRMQGRLVRFGYLTLEAKNANPFLPVGARIRAHEFHYSDSDSNGSGMLAEKRGRSWECVHTSDVMYAGYPHLNLAAHPEYARRFAEKCLEFAEKRRKENG